MLRLIQSSDSFRWVLSGSGEKPEGTKKAAHGILPNQPNMPALSQENSVLDWQGAVPTQLGTRTLWFQTLFSLLSQTDHVPCPFLLRCLLEEIRHLDQTAPDTSYSFVLSQALQERCHFDPLLAKAFEILKSLDNPGLVGAMGYLLARLGESLELPVVEIPPGELRQFFQQKANQELVTEPMQSWPPWGKLTLEKLLLPCLSLESTDLSLLTSGVGQWTVSDREWIREVNAAKMWFLQWRKKTPCLPQWGSQTVWETKGPNGHQQQGGLETLVCRGPLESLLPSELVWTNEPGALFAWKWTQGELLYFGREQATALRPSLCWNLDWDVSVLDWQFWAEGCPGRMGAMAWGWVLSVLEAVHQDRGEWKIQAHWNLVNRKSKTWESSLARMHHVVGVANPFCSVWVQNGEDFKGSLGTHSFTHRCFFQIGGGIGNTRGIHLHPAKGPKGDNSVPLGLVGHPHTIEEWLDWDNQVMFELGHYWIAKGEWDERTKKPV